MKIHTSLLLALGGFIVIESCSNSFIDVTPNALVPESLFWKTEADATLALTGCYNNWNGWANTIYADGASDNGYAQYSYGYRELGNGSMTSATSTEAWPDVAAGKWFSYIRVRKYNDFLARIDKVAMDAAKKEKYKMEVRFLRAFDYFDKVIHYGGVPIVTEIIADTEKSKLPRVSQAEVEKFVLDELDVIIASKVLPVQNMVESKGHITMGAVYALKARFNLYLGNWQAAQEAAKAVIGMPCYELFQGGYRELFLEANETNNKEAILSIQYMPDRYSNYASRTLLPNSQAGWAGLQASWDLVKAYESKDGSAFDETKPFDNKDPRLAMTMLYPGAPYPFAVKPKDSNDKTLDYFDPYNGPDKAGSPINLPSLMPVYKYAMPSDNPANQGGDVMIFRLAEMYLTFAEAALKTNTDKDLALQYINAIRARKSVEMPTATALTEALVRNERRVELAFEGLRYFDIKRWNIGSTALNGKVYGAKQGSVDQATGKVTWKGDHVVVEERVFKPERAYLWPIPLSEITVNPNMTQNPDYN